MADPATDYELYPKAGGILQWAGPAESREAALNVLCGDVADPDAGLSVADMMTACPSSIDNEDMMNRAFTDNPF